MSSPVQQKILRALLTAMRPIARALMAAGIGYKEFAEVSKTAFVDVAASDYGIRGRRTNDSRVAVITGLSRKDVKRIRDRGHSGVTSETFKKESPASVVLHNWNNDLDFCYEKGKPKELRFSGSGATFCALVARSAGDIPAGAMRTELLRVDAIEVDDKDTLRVKKPFFVPAGLDDRLVISLEEILASAADTMAYNCDPKRKGPARFQRVASVDGIEEQFFGEIQTAASQKLTEFGLDFCSYLDEFERKSSKKDRSEETTQIGVGLYYYQLVGTENR
jgi:hypothetical protein